MTTTEHIHLPLYTDEETPDLSTTGHYNHAMEIIDTNVGELEAKDAELADDLADERKARVTGDSALDAKLAAETKARADADTALDTAYKAADTALGSRIDNAETEISANSADLTGIKGLTYGADHVQFIENENGSYASPALDEIAEQVSSGLKFINLGTIPADDISDIDVAKSQAIKDNWPNVAVIANNCVYTPSLNAGQDGYVFVSPESYVGDATAPLIKRLQFFANYNQITSSPYDPVRILQPHYSRLPCMATGTDAIALGSGSYAPAANSVALGAGSVASNRGNTVSIGSEDSQRIIENVKDPQLASDAATKNYVDSNTPSDYINANTTWGEIEQP